MAAFIMLVAILVFVAIKPAIYKILLASGIILWMVSFVGEGFLYQPYSTIAMFIAVVLFIAGVLFAAIRYLQQKALIGPSFDVFAFPKNASLSVRVEFVLKFIFGFWTFCIAFFMGIILIMVLTFRNGDAFKTTRQYCLEDKSILSKTGPIKYFGLLVAGNITSTSNGGKAATTTAALCKPCCGTSATAADKAINAAVTGCCWPVVKVTP